MGGVVAFEMARQLRKTGQAVACLVLIDSVAHSDPFGDPVSVVRRSARRLQHLLSFEPSQAFDKARHRAYKTARRFLRTTTNPGTPIELDDVMDTRELPAVYRREAERHFRLVRDYRCLPYEGDVWLLRTEDPRYQEDLGWKPLVEGDFQVSKIPGDHTTIFREPHLEALGNKLAKILRRNSPGGESIKGLAEG